MAAVVVAGDVVGVAVVVTSSDDASGRHEASGQVLVLGKVLGRDLGSCEAVRASVLVDLGSFGAVLEVVLVGSLVDPGTHETVRASALVGKLALALGSSVAALAWVLADFGTRGTVRASTLDGNFPLVLVDLALVPVAPGTHWTVPALPGIPEMALAAD